MIHDASTIQSLPNRLGKMGAVSIGCQNEVVRVLIWLQILLKQLDNLAHNVGVNPSF